jgi:Asp-tRNA(Asn)/Glu-tRNA(Gln) amidotransferase A subunit family amidase
MSGLPGKFRARRGIGGSYKLIAAAIVTTGALQARATILSLDLPDLTASQIQAGYVAHTWTPTDIVDTYLAQITKYNPVYDAYEQLNLSVQQDAVAETQALNTPGFTIPDGVWGVPTAIKDAMNVAGMRTTGGSSYLGTANLGIGTGSPSTGAIDLIPSQDNTQVARLRAAGALILGKTNVCDFYRTGNNSNSTLNGDTRNAYDTSRTPGGSSGGSGVAVATGMTCIATAEETGSSITNPSSAASIVGIKPTFGTIPSDGAFPLQGYYRDTDGTFGKNVHDAAAMFDVEAGPSPSDPKPNPVNNNIPAGGFVNYINTHQHALQGARIGVLDLNGAGFSTTKVTNTEAINLFNAQLTKLSAAGATLVTDPFVADNGSWTAAQANFPASNTFSYDIETYLKTMGPNSIHSTQEYDATVAPISGKTWYQIPNMPAMTTVNSVYNDDDPATRSDLTAYNTRVAQLRALFAQIMDSQNLDALVLPQLAAPVGSLPNGAITRTPGGAPNIMGTPGVTVPGGYFSDGTPFEMYFIGDLNHDAQLLALASDYESVTENRIAPTLVDSPAPIPEPIAMSAVVFSALLGLRRARRHGQLC